MWLIVVIYNVTTVETAVVETSANQPTTLIVRLADNYKVQVTWKKDGRRVKHSVLPDGSLYITNTALTDKGEYTMTVQKNKGTVVENLNLRVFDPRLPPG